MRYLLLILAFSIGNLRAQSDTTKYFKSVDYGWKYQRIYTPLVFAPPQDTVYGKWGLAMKGNSLFLGNGSYWRAVGGSTIDTASYVKRAELLDSLSSVRDAYQQYTNDYVNENNVAYIDPILATKVNIADSNFRYVTPTQLSTKVTTNSEGVLTGIKATSSAGITIKANSGTTVATFGQGGGANANIGNLSVGSAISFNSKRLADTTDLSGLATTSSVNSALALKENSITPSNTVGRYWNGYKNFVHLLSDSITEGSKLFYTDSRARNAISVSGSLIYNSSTGIISYTQPSNVSTFTNDAGYITSSALSPYLTSTSATSTYVPQTRTINGLDLSANRTLTSTNIGEGTNLYYTDARARQAISLTTTGSGAATYNNSTGVLNVPTNTGIDTSVTRQPFTFLGRKSGTGGWSQQQYFDTTWFNNLFATYVRAAQNNSSANPAGSNAQIQYNNSGSFGASADFTWDNTGKVLITQFANTGWRFSQQTVNGGNQSCIYPTGVTASGTNYVFTTNNSGQFVNINAVGSGGLLGLGANGSIALIAGASNVSIGTNSPTGARLDLINTVSGTAATTLLNAASTWNTSGNPTAIRLNITNTASGATARLIDLQVGGTTQFAVDKVGKLNIATGTNASVGTATLSGGAITVNTTAVTASSVILLTLQNCSNCGTPYINGRVAGTSFTIASTNVLDGSIVAYQIIN
jgi:hypothetical protein